MEDRAAREVWAHNGTTWVKEDDLCMAEEQIVFLQQRVEVLRKGLLAVETLIDNSRGVTGLHMNGDEAPWDSLRTGGYFEDWLTAFDEALAAQDRGGEQGEG